jgi:hypothetical protein
MPSESSRQILRRGLAVGVTAGLMLGMVVSQAHAGDDGQAPIWEGITSVFGPYLGYSKDEPLIDYRDRGRLVLPPKIALQPPSPPAVGPGNVDWPVDPDVQREKKAKQDRKAPTKEHFGRNSTMIPPGAVVTVTMKANAGQGPADPPACPKDAAPGSCAKSNYGHATPNFNPLTWVGLQKKDDVVLGPEPDRTDLTDPPKGLRAPVEGPGAKIEN